jgi:hypothetical protein
MQCCDTMASIEGARRSVFVDLLSSAGRRCLPPMEVLR